MPTVMWEDDCLVPDRRIILEYKGPNVFEVYKKIKDLTKATLQIGSSKYFERDFRWDVVNNSFFVRIYAKHPLDANSNGWYEIVLEGVQPKDPNKAGKLTVIIYPRLETKFKLDTPFKNSPIYKSFIYIYVKLFYQKTRRKYLEMCRSLAKRLETEIRNILKMPLS